MPVPYSAASEALNEYSHRGREGKRASEKALQTSDTVPARDGDEAQRGLNDTFPGDPYPVRGILHAIRQRSVQAIGAGISRHDWHATETAYNELRDKLDDVIRRLA